jgi:rhomboid protease GluP
MQIASAVFEARSHAQAMDWSLVLISQGIENTVLQREDGTWLVEFPAAETERASASVAAYERENATIWRHEVKWTGLLFDARALFWYAALVLVFWFDARSTADLRDLGKVIRSALPPEWWRLFTAVTLHADIAHLAANVTTGVVFTGLAMGCMGAGNALLLSFVSGVLGNVVSALLHENPFQSLGASGMVMGSLGLLTAQSLITARHERPKLLLGRGAVAGCLLVVMLGLSPQSDVLAHVGGFVAGVALGVPAMRVGPKLHSRSLNVASFVVLVLSVAAAWWSAVNRG